MIVKIDIVPEPKKFFHSIGVSIRDYVRNVMDELYDKMPERMGEVFDGEGTRHGDGERWESTSNEARDKRASGNFFANTLEDTGYLSNSMNSDYFEIPDEHVLIVGANQSDKWATKHPLGDPKMKLKHSKTSEPGWDLDKLSKREFAFLVPDDVEFVREVIDRIEIE